MKQQVNKATGLSDEYFDYVEVFHSRIDDDFEKMMQGRHYEAEQDEAGHHPGMALRLRSLEGPK